MIGVTISNKDLYIFIEICCQINISPILKSYIDFWKMKLVK